MDYIKSFHLDDAIKSVLEYYKDKDEYLQKQTPKITSAIEGYKFILKNIEIYKKLAKLEYQNYKEYIEKFNIDKNNIAVIEIQNRWIDYFFFTYENNYLYIIEGEAQTNLVFNNLRNKCNKCIKNM